ncbi:MAG TPA: hypothetical protein VF755_29465 [Catenuloplanes sp.]
MLQWQMYTLAPVIGVLVSAVVGVLAWRRRAQTPAALPLVVVMVGLVWWAGEDAIGSLCTDPDVKAAFALASFPAPAPPPSASAGSAARWPAGTPDSRGCCSRSCWWSRC